MPFKRVSSQVFINQTTPRGKEEHALPDSLADQLKRRILVVDDEPFNILAIKSYVKDLDIHVEAAFNGKDAIEKINKASQSVMP